MPQSADYGVVDDKGFGAKFTNHTLDKTQTSISTNLLLPPLNGQFMSK